MNYQCGNRTCRARRSTNKPLPPDTLCRRCGRGRMNNCTRHVRRWNARHLKCTCGLIEYPHREGSRHGDDFCAAHPDCDPWGNKYGPDN